jgi:hypothetical protein
MVAYRTDPGNFGSRVPPSPTAALIQALVAERPVALPPAKQGGDVMVIDDDCVGYARECVRLAGLTKDPQVQEQLLNMAREWMAVAMHEQKMPNPKSATA